MEFIQFKNKYLKEPVVAYKNNRADKKPLVTVKVVTYNHHAFIKECLDAILQQKTSFDFEILIAEDASNDGTREICIAYAEKYPNKIRLLLNSRENNIQVNGKPSGLFNNVYANFSSKGKYLCTIEGDDYWTDELSLQKRVDFLEKNEDYVACFHHTVVRKDTNIISSIFNFTKDKTIEPQDFLKIIFPTISLIYRNGLFDYWDEKMKTVVCGDLISRGKLSLHGKAFFFNDLKPAVYRHHKGGVFSMIALKRQTELAVEGLEYLYNYNNESKELKQGISFLYLSYFVSLLKRDKTLKINYLSKSYTIGKSINYSLINIIRDHKSINK